MAIFGECEIIVAVGVLYLDEARRFLGRKWGNKLWESGRRDSSLLLTSSFFLLVDLTRPRQ